MIDMDRFQTLNWYFYTRWLNDRNGSVTCRSWLASHRLLQCPKMTATGQNQPFATLAVSLDGRVRGVLWGPGEPWVRVVLAVHLSVVCRVVVGGKEAKHALSKKLQAGF